VIAIGGGASAPLAPPGFAPLDPGLITYQIYKIIDRLDEDNGTLSFFFWDSVIFVEARTVVGHVRKRV
jgi:hypothetical protein